MRNSVLCAASILMLALVFPGAAHSHETEDAHSTGCIPGTNLNTANSVCSACHKDAQKRFAPQEKLFCTPYCLNCHTKAEMERHHTVDILLPREAGSPLYLTATRKMACMTCHNMTQARYDSERWKSTSLFDRLFHQENRYKTFFLSMRNDQGQLCLTCH